MRKVSRNHQQRLKSIFDFGSPAVGATLVEVMIAAAIMIGVVVGTVLLLPHAMKAIVKVQTRSNAVNLASTKLDLATNHPYAVIPVTPDGPNGNDYFNVNSSTGLCDCSNVNWGMTIPGGNSTTAPEIITQGGITYTRQTCVNYLYNSPTLGWQSNCTSDKGLKNVVVNVSWTLGNEAQSYTMQSLASAPAALSTMNSSTGTVAVTVCPADGTLPPGTPVCNMANLSAVQTAEVALSNNFGFLAENGHVVPNGNIVRLQAPQGAYNLHVQQTGYFPYYSQIPINVISGQTTPVTVILRDTHNYGAQLVGEASVANHPVISKVIDAVAQPTGGCTTPSPVTGSCDDASEAVEIYNPTTSTFTVGPSGNLSLQYCNTSTCWPSNPSHNFFTEPGGPTFTTSTGGNVFLYPGSYLLIVGKDPRQPQLPPNYTEWGTKSDITYSVLDPNANGGTGLGLIP